MVHAAIGSFIAEIRAAPSLLYSSDSILQDEYRGDGTWRKPPARPRSRAGPGGKISTNPLPLMSCEKLKTKTASGTGAAWSSDPAVACRARAPIDRARRR